ncbi:MAG TPA: immunoglobulin domain-containing protein [Verrucomicrobiae bacterium]|jgi:hypothetical protein|nr:immunoglobulin domain-containing protein [Verrucomicrobiae bacterium]
MKHKLNFRMIGAAGLAIAGCACAQTYDLGIDFQDDVIPSVGINGVWSYGFDQTDTTGNIADPIIFTPYSLHGGAPAGPDAYYTNGPLSIYQSPGSGGYGVITHDSDVPNERAVIRWTAPVAGTIYVDGSSWKFTFNQGDGRMQDYYVRVNNNPFLAAGTVSDSTLNDGSGVNLPQNEIHWSASAAVNAGDNLDIIYWRHPGSVQSYSGYTETINYVPAGSPLITTQPTNAQIAAGGSTTLTVGASGSGLSYQWYHNDTLISGATSSSLAINNSGVSDLGLYYVVVMNSINTRTSAVAVVDVLAPASGVHNAAGDFSLASNPTARGWQYSQAVASGGTGGGPRTAEWNSQDFGPGQPGWLGAPLNPQAGFARVLENPNSYDAPLGTLIGYGPSSILWQAPAGDTNSFISISGGLWNIRHVGETGNWSIYKNGTILTSGTIDDSTGTSAAPKSFATGSGGSDALVTSYAPGDVFRLELDEFEYQGIVFNLATTNVSPDPFITLQPAPQSVPQGATATFHLGATGSSPLTYQWFFNNGAITDATNATLNINNVQNSDVGSYQATVTSPKGTLHSVVVSLAISQQPIGTPWDLAGDWIDDVLPPINIGPEGAWSYGYSLMSDPSSTNYLDPLNFTPYPVWDNSHSFVGGPGQYSVTPSDPESSESLGSFVANHTSGGPNFQPTIFRWTAKRDITVNAQGSVWTTDGNGRTQQYFVRKNTNQFVYAQGTVDDSITGGNPLTWSTNGISLKSGDYIDLYVRRTPNDTQSFIDVTEQIVEAPAGTPHITVQPGPLSQIVAASANVTYTVTATGANLTYDWQRNGVDLGVNTPTLTLTQVGTAQNGVYTVTVSNGIGSTTSDPVSLSVDNTAPTVASAARSFLALNQVTLTYSEPVQGSGATNLANYSINNGNSVTAAVANSNLTSVTLTLANNIANNTTNVLTLNNIKDTVGNTIAANTLVTIAVPSDVTHVQDSSSDHLLVVEAEDYNRNLSPSTDGNSWIFVTTPTDLHPTDVNTNYSGTGAMEADPNLGHNRGSVTSGPELDYKVYFPTAGSNYVFIRGVGDSAPGPSADDSILVGLDGVLTTLWTGFPQGQGYVWGNTPIAGSGPMVVTTPGIHVVNVWMREDGFAFDKLLITSNPNYVPTGIGPAESLVLGPTISVSLTGGNVSISWAGGGVLESSATVDGSYAVVPGATSPYVIAPTGAQKFYIVKQ